MTTTVSTADLKRRMHGAVEALRHDLQGLRTGRASTPTAVSIARCSRTLPCSANTPITGLLTASPFVAS